MHLAVKGRYHKSYCKLLFAQNNNSVNVQCMAVIQFLSFLNLSSFAEQENNSVTVQTKCSVYLKFCFFLTFLGRSNRVKLM